MSCLLRSLAAFLLGAGVTWLALGSQALRDELLRVDRAFDQRTAEQGLEGWVSFFAEDGMMAGSGGIAKGRRAVRELMAPFFSKPGNTLRWKPVLAAVSTSGDLGYTVGESLRTVDDQKGRLTQSRGRYVTIWRKQRDGAWKVELDTGASLPPKSVAADAQRRP